MRLINYLNPLQYFPNPRLDDVLILVPSATQPKARTRVFMDQLTMAGATFCTSSGVSDVALHRCLVAARAMEGLANESSKAIRFVMWLDDDMVGTPSHVAFMRAALGVEKPVAVEIGEPLLGQAVTGIYCKRNQPNQVTIRPCPGETMRNSWLIVDQAQEPDATRVVTYESHPVLSGLGCLMMHRTTFVRHCQSFPAFGTHSRGNASIPAICASGLVPDEDGRLGWISEDQTYCTGLWQYCGGVWTVPIAFGHISEVSLLPKPDADWLETDGDTERPPEIDQSSST